MTRGLIRDICARYPFQIIGTTGLIILGGLLNTGAIVALAPLAEIYLYDSNENLSSLSEFFRRLLSHVGMEFSLGPMGALVLIFTIAATFMSSIVDYSIEKIRFSILRQITSSTFQVMFSSQWYFFVNQEHGSLINTFIREISQVGDSLQTAGRLFAVSIQLVIILFAAFYISWKVSLVCVAGVLLFVWPFILLDRIGYKLGAKITEASNRLVTVIHESFGAAQIILGYGKKEKSVERLEKAFDQSASASLKWTLLVTAMQRIYQPISVIALIVGLFLSKNSGLTPGETAALIYALVRSNGNVRAMAGLYGILSKQRASWNQLAELTGIAANLRAPSASKKFDRVKKELVFKDVSFNYPGSPEILAEVNLRIQPGMITALVGPSGSGKTTILNLIMCLVYPTKGDILVDGRLLKEYDPNSYRARVGYVPQETTFFNDTIRNNLLWAMPEATEKEIIEACEQSEAIEFIRNMKFGFDTVVGEKGARLSGGQAQRISLARALLRKPDILALDEAFSSLDPETEMEILKLLQSNIAQKAAVIMATHRVTGLTIADRAYIVENGRVRAMEQQKIGA